MFLFGRTPTKHENNVFRLFKLFNTSSTSFCCFFSRMIITRTHTTKTDMVKDQLLFRGFQQDGPFPLHIGPAVSVCVGGCLADLAGELEELKCPFFLSAGFSAQVLFWKACGLRDPPQYKDKDSGAKVECCLARPWFIERDCKKKTLKIQRGEELFYSTIHFRIVRPACSEHVCGSERPKPKIWGWCTSQPSLRTLIVWDVHPRYKELVFAQFSTLPNSLSYRAKCTYTAIQNSRLISSLVWAV